MAFEPRQLSDEELKKLLFLSEHRNAVMWPMAFEDGLQFALSHIAWLTEQLRKADDRAGLAEHYAQAKVKSQERKEMLQRLYDVHDPFTMNRTFKEKVRHALSDLTSEHEHRMMISAHQVGDEEPDDCGYGLTADGV